MTKRKRRQVARVLHLFGSVILIAALVSLFKGKLAKPEVQPASPPNPPEHFRAEMTAYSLGYGLALILTASAFALVHWRWASKSVALFMVFTLALIQVAVHFRCFLHVKLGGPSRDDLSLILFSSVIIFLMVGGTLVILFNLRMRMM